MSKGIGKSDIVESVSVGFMFSIVALFVYRIGMNADFFFYDENGVTLSRTIELFRQYTKSGFFIGLISVWAGSAFLYLLMIKMDRKYRKIIYRYRYVIVLIILAICVVLEISGSSMSSWCGVLGVSQEDSGVLFRTMNPYRSDEFGVNTVFAIAQAKNPGNSYPYFSDIVRGTSTDMYIVYGQPVKSIGILFRPFQWGYLLLGSAKGLAFFWCGRFLFLLMSSFEFGRLFINNKRMPSVIYSIFMTLSPVVQWWFAINGFVEMLIFGQLCAIMLSRYMNTDSVRKKLLYSLIFFWSGGVYILVFYPAWQIVMGYVFLGIFIWIILENRKQLCWRWKVDLPIILCTGIMIGGLIGILMFKSRDTISAVLNTVYPGHRVDNGKLEILDIFGGIYNLFLPLTDSHIILTWGFIDFCPLGIILALYVILKDKKKDKLLITMLIIDVVFIIIFMCPIPSMVKRITLLSMTTSDRALIAIQFVNILLLFRGMSLIEFKGKAYKIALGGVVYASVIVWIINNQAEDIPLSNLMTVGMFVVLFVVFVLMWMNNALNINRYLLSVFLVVFVIAGGLVNPVQQGLPFIENSDVVQEIDRIVNADCKGKWIVEGMGYPNTNLPLFGGASTINSTNVYPALDTWEKLDASGQYNEVYNRYAHIEMSLQDDKKTEFVLKYPDYFMVELNVNDLKQINVSYILSPNDLEKFSGEHISIKRIESINNLHIYSVDYQ